MLKLRAQSFFLLTRSVSTAGIGPVLEDRCQKGKSKQSDVIKEAVHLTDSLSGYATRTRKRVSRVSEPAPE